jgi:mannitol/fructose-specific phosphotransferase system IIA component (Ntr-type)
MSPLLALAIILMAGLLGERLARRLGVPGLTGNLAAGMFIGPACLNLFAGMDVVDGFAPLSMFAMVFIALAVGSQLSYQRIHNALGRIACIAIGESLAAGLLVAAAAYAWTRNVWVALLLGALAMETAPTATLAIVRENKARGPFVKTLMAVVAVDCSLCILVFAFVQGWVAEHFSGQGFVGGHPGIHLAWQAGGAVLLAAAIAASMEFLIHRWRLSELVSVFLAILMVAGLSELFHVNRLLVGLVLGVLLTNFSHDAEEYGRAFEPIELLLFTGFFTMAGISLHWQSLSHAGALCLLYVLVRAAGKGMGAFLGGRLAGSPERIARNLPLSLVPQAGVAAGLIIVLQNDARIPEQISDLISATVLAAIAINEIVGPFLTRLALRRANEAGRDRPKLMDFLQEESIATHLKAANKWEAIQKATDFYLRTHRLPGAQQEVVRATILEREKSMSTAVGHGIAIPHGRVEAGASLQGVLAIFEEGVEFEAPDGAPVQIIILIVTPSEHEQRHAQVLASLSGMLLNPAIRERLIAARSAHDVWEIIEDEEYRDFNYFLEESGDTPEKPSIDFG